MKYGFTAWPIYMLINRFYTFMNKSFEYNYFAGGETYYTNRKYIVLLYSVPYLTKSMTNSSNYLLTTH